MAIVSAENYLTSLRALRPELAARFKVKEIGLFGSVVRGEQSQGSDLDVLVEFDAGADLFDLCGLAAFLEQQFERKVDVVPRRALRAELRSAILHELVAA